MMRVGGTLFSYWFICKRKAWYFSHGIWMEQENEYVQLGKLVDETSYSRERKHLLIDDIAVDFLRDGIIHEIKKSQSMQDASIWQVKYYLYRLKRYGLDELKGRLDYPLLRKGLDIQLEKDDEEKIEQILGELTNCIESPTPPIIKESNICRKCAFSDLCWI